MESGKHVRSSRSVDEMNVIENMLIYHVVNYEYSRIVGLYHAVLDVLIEEGIIGMRTTESLTRSVTYLNGDPVFNGAVERIYTSEILLSLQVHLVRAPQGAKIENFADDELKTVVKRLRPNQIGALKDVSENPVLGSEPFLELVIACDANNTVAVADSCKSVAKSDNITDGMTCTVKAKPIAVEAVKELAVPNRDSNRAIQKKWLKFVETDRAKAMSSADKLLQKELMYSDYVSLTEYTLVVSGMIKHIVNNPSLKATVSANADEKYYNLVNYTRGNTQVHKTALERLQLVSIPITTRDDYDKALNRLGQFAKTNANVAKIRQTFKAEDVYHDEGIFANTSLDWEKLKALDNLARKNLRKA